MVMSTMVSGSMTRLMEEETTNTSMGLSILVSGRKTLSMVLDLKLGQISQSMKAATSLERNMELVFSDGQTALCISESFTVTISMAKESTLGLMVGDMKENGVRTRCMVREHSHG